MGWINDAIVKFKCFVINRRENSDKEVVKRIFRERMGYELDLKHPQTFNEKLQWLKLYDHKPIYTKMVDKREAKNYVARIIGSEHIIPTLGVYDRFDEIDFDRLPDRFVLKCTHNSGGILLCKDKKAFDIGAAKKLFDEQMNYNFYLHTREWPYKNVKPRIIAEAFMEQETGEGLMDYKFYCFHGEPKFLYISKGLENHATASISFVNLDWTFAPFQRSDFKPFEELPPKPARFDEMLKIAKKLSTGRKFLRVDLYEINGKVYFSELTFFPCGGYMKFQNSEHDLEIGRMLPLK